MSTDLAGRNTEPVGHRRVALRITAAQLAGTAAELLADGYRLALVAAHDDGEPAMRVVYLFTAGRPDRRVELHLHLDRANPAVPSLAALSFPCGRFERQMRDLFGITPTGHPMPRRLVRHKHWPAGWYPMRADAPTLPPDGPGEEPFPFVMVDGRGVCEVPVGPVHAGLIEPGHFRFSVFGEQIVKMKPRLSYLHRGMERLFHGRQVADGIALAERISGDTTIGHTTAYCMAVEDAMGIAVSARTVRARAALLELERLYNHVGDLGALCNDVGHGILLAHAMRVRESLLRLAKRTTGHRLLRGGVVLGGAALLEVPSTEEIAAIGRQIAEIVALGLGNSMVAERFATTACLDLAKAHDLGTVGPVARASGIDIDARRDHPAVCAQGDPAEGVAELLVPVGGAGDVLARFNQRAAEAVVSVSLLQRLLPGLSAGLEVADVLADAGAPDGGVAGVRSGVGIVEGWRGTITHRVELDEVGVLRRVKVVDPSFFNWPALPFALADTIVPDFPLANKSFNLSYAGNDL